MFSSSAYSLMRGFLFRKQTCAVTIVTAYWFSEIERMVFHRRWKLNCGELSARGHVTGVYRRVSADRSSEGQSDSESAKNVESRSTCCTCCRVVFLSRVSDIDIANLSVCS